MHYELTRCYGGQFIFVNQGGCEIGVHNLIELNKCKYLTALTINAASNIEKLDFSGFSNFKRLNLANCDGLRSLKLPAYYGLQNQILEYLNVSSNGIDGVDISNCSHLQHFYANSCLNLRKIITGPQNTALQSIQACDNRALESVDVAGCVRCENFNFRDCLNLTTLIHPNECDGIPTFHLMGCQSLSRETRNSLNAIQSRKHLHMDR